MHEFGSSGATDGIGASSLIQGSDGKLYGTMSSNREGFGGTVFQIDTSGELPDFTVLHYFDSPDNNATGSGPRSLIQGVDGKLYGMSMSTNDRALMFQLDISGSAPIYTALHKFDINRLDPFFPDFNNNRLIQGSDGTFYVYQNAGGQFGRGAIYSLKLDTTPANTPPVAANDSYALVAPKYNKPITVAAPGVLKNDKDGEGDKLTVVGATMSAPKLIELPKGGGKVALYADGHFNYTSARKRFNGTTSFCYQVTDGLATSNPATVTLTVHCKDSGHNHRKQRGHKGEG